MSDKGSGMYLHQKIEVWVDDLRKPKHPCVDYPAIRENLDWPMPGNRNYMVPAASDCENMLVSAPRRDGGACRNLNEKPYAVAQIKISCPSF